MKHPTSFQKIWAFSARSGLVNRRNVFAAFEMLFWPAMGIFSVGLLTSFLNLSGETVTFILIGAISMNTVQIAQLDLSYALLYSVWSKSLKHEFIAPIRLIHILLGCGLVGLIRGFLVFVGMAVLSVWLFHMELDRPGPGGLAVFLAGMFINAAIIGALVLALVLRFGQRAEVAGLVLLLPDAAVVRDLLSGQRAAGVGPGAGLLHPAHLFPGVLPPLLRLSAALQPTPALRLLFEYGIPDRQLRTAALHFRVRLPGRHPATAVRMMVSSFECLGGAGVPPVLVW